MIVGMEAVLDQILVALLAGGRAYLEGPPGTAKTLLVQGFGSYAIGGQFHRIQFTPEPNAGRHRGRQHVQQAGNETFQFAPGPIFCDLLLADEINRAPAKTQSALLEAMQEAGQVSVDGQSHRLSDVFTAFATQNPRSIQRDVFPCPRPNWIAFC